MADKNPKEKDPKDKDLGGDKDKKAKSGQKNDTDGDEGEQQTSFLANLKKDKKMLVIFGSLISIITLLMISMLIMLLTGKDKNQDKLISVGFKQEAPKNTKPSSENASEEDTHASGSPDPEQAASTVENPMPDKPAEGDAAASEKPADSHNNEPETHDASTDDKSKTQEQSLNAGKAKAVYYKINPAFVVNFQDSKKARLLQITVEIMARDDKIIQVVKDNLPLIQNNLVQLFGSQKYDNLISPAGKDSLREDAKQVVNDVIKKESKFSGIEEILFTTFFFQ